MRGNSSIIWPWRTAITLIAISVKPCPASAFSTISSRSKTVTRTVRQSTAEPLDAALDKGSTTKKEKPSWFPRRPEDALFQEYDTLVQGAYVRHVVLETKDMADLAIQMYLKGGENDESSNVELSSQDPFSKLAQDLSACTLSREEGGKIGALTFILVRHVLCRNTCSAHMHFLKGWIDNPFHESNRNNELVNDVVNGLIPNTVIEQLFKARPKGGDLLKLAVHRDNDDSDEEEGLSDRWHLCRIDDLLIDFIPNSKPDGSKAHFQFKQNGVNKVITDRSKLKGTGTTPKAPRIIQYKAKSTVENDTVNDDANMAKSYHIATTGCQMNVSDSERLAGVLQNNLKLTESSDPSKANVIILNTCSIRDHAEQKVYDMLGPYAARKRKGEALALVVSGCVAQQEGEALLKRVPEVDLVMVCFNVIVPALVALCISI